MRRGAVCVLALGLLRESRASIVCVECVVCHLLNAAGTLSLSLLRLYVRRGWAPHAAMCGDR